MSNQTRQPVSPASLSQVLGESAAEVSFRESFPPATLLKVGVLAVLLVALHFWQVDWLARKLQHPNWSYGFIIPLFSLYLLYARREDLMTAPRRVCWIGLLIFLVALGGEFLAIVQVKNFWISQLCMVMMVFGLVLYLAGPAVLRVAWVPILFLAFAMPLPDLYYNRVSLPMQNLAAKGAVAALRFGGVEIVSSASSLDIISRSGQHQQLEVAEACSGMRLLLAFLALGVAMAYLDYKPVWQRVTLVAMAIPIAIFCNVMRVTITCALYYADKKELGEDFMHTFLGMLMLIPAFVLLWLLAKLLRWVAAGGQDDAAAPESPS